MIVIYLTFIKSHKSLLTLFLIASPSRLRTFSKRVWASKSRNAIEESLGLESPSLTALEGGIEEVFIFASIYIWHLCCQVLGWPEVNSIKNGRSPEQARCLLFSQLNLAA